MGYILASLPASRFAGLRKAGLRDYRAIRTPKNVFIWHLARIVFGPAATEWRKLLAHGVSRGIANAVWAEASERRQSPG